jgi:hypothetical protein
MIGMLFAVGVGLWACGCGPGGLFPVTCDSVTFTPGSAQPLSEIMVGGVPRRGQDLFAAMFIGGSAEAMPAFVERREDGTVILHTPFHPADPIGGGAVSVQIAGSNFTCPPAALTILPLPPAPGALAAAVDELEESLRVRIEWFGSTLDDLLGADQPAVPAHLLPLLAADTVISNPNNPNSLRALAGGTAPYFGDGEVDLDLLDRVIARVGLTAVLAAERAELPDLSAGAAAPAKRRTAMQVTGDIPHVSIESAAELDRYMSIAAASAFSTALEGPTVRLRRNLGMAMGFLGVVPGRSADVAAAGTGAALYAYDQMRRGLAGLLPAQFVEDGLLFEFGPVEFLEDEEPPIGQWSNVLVEATSNGWTLDEAVVNGLLAGGGFIDGFDVWLNANARPGFKDDVDGFVFNSLLDQLVDLSQSEALVIEPFTWPAVDVTGEPWTVGESVGDLLAVDSAALTYEPAAVGMGQLLVRTGDDRFGSQRAERVAAIQVRAIEVTIDPEMVRVEPGQAIALTARVANAMDESVEWRATPNVGTLDPAFSFGDGPHRAQFTAPINPTSFPITITVTSISESGLRAAASAPARSASALIASGIEVTVTPDSVCLQPGETLTFTATVVGWSNTAVTWSASAGTITSAGVFTAGPGSGTVTVTATSVVDTEGSGEAVVEIGACGCAWEAVLTGDFTATYSGAYAVFTNLGGLGTPGGLLSIELAQRIGSGAGGSLSANGRPLPGETGTFTDVSLTFDDGGPNSFTGGGSGAPLRLIVQRNSGGRMEGVIEGTVTSPNPANIAETRVSQIAITFRAGQSTLDPFDDSCPD